MCFSVDLIELFGFPKEFWTYIFYLMSLAPSLFIRYECKGNLNFFNEIDALEGQKIKNLNATSEFLEFHGKEEKERFVLLECI